MSLYRGFVDELAVSTGIAPLAVYKAGQRKLVGVLARELGKKVGRQQA